MDYLMEGDELNPVAVERDLGVARGTVRSLTMSSEGCVKIDIDPSIDTVQNKQKIKDIMVRNGLIRGKKKAA